MKNILILLFVSFSFFSCNGAKTNVSQHTEPPIKTQKVSTIPILSQDLSFDFEGENVGKLPQNWSQAFTGRGRHTDWQVIDDNGNKVLAQLSHDHPNYHFNDIVFDAFVATDVVLEVKIKGVDGRMDQGGGFIWRWTDKDNYYVVRANPLEDNVVLYKVKNGKRTDLPIMGKGRTYGVEVPTLGNGWNNLKLDVKANLFIVYLNDNELFRVQDDTFAKAGKVGLWTKADAVTYFDDFHVLKH